MKLEPYPLNLDITDTDLLYSKLSKLNIDILVSNAGIGNGIEGLLKSTKTDILKSTRVNYEVNFTYYKKIFSS